MFIFMKIGSASFNEFLLNSLLQDRQYNFILNLTNVKFKIFYILFNYIDIEISDFIVHYFEFLYFI